MFLNVLHITQIHEAIKIVGTVSVELAGAIAALEHAYRCLKYAFFIIEVR